MTTLSQSPRDRILWILVNNGGKMERSRLIACTGMRYALLNPILEELAKEGRIRLTVGKHEDLISLRIDKAKVSDYIAGNDGQVTDRMTRNSSLAVVQGKLPYH